MKRIFQNTFPSLPPYDDAPRTGLVENYERPTKLRKLASSNEAAAELDLSGSCALVPKLLKELAILVPNLLSINLSRCNYLGEEDLEILFSGIGPSTSQCTIQTVDLSHTQITDSAIQLIALKCPNLSSINLEGCHNVTDLGLSLLSQHSKDLSQLFLADCARISDTGVQLVAQESKQRLNLLDLNDCTRITDRSLAYLGYYCPNLSCLRLKNCSVTSNVLCKLLPRLCGLCELNVQGVRGIDDRFLFALSRFQRATLRSFDVSFCYSVTAEGLLRVVSESADSLREVSLYGLSLPQAEVLQLQRHYSSISFLSTTI